TGYCIVCGDLGCGECLNEHENQLYCEKHFRPFAKQLQEQERRQQVRQKFARQRLVIRYKDKRRLSGVSFTLNPRGTEFHLDVVNTEGVPTGESVLVKFDELKAIFYVKSFDGNFDKSTIYREWIPEGKEMVVKFTDGEVIRGFSLQQYKGDEIRFYLIPNDPSSNNISMLIERSAVEQVFVASEYEAQRAKEREERKTPDVIEDLSQEETMGDFNFENRNYEAALALYEDAIRKFPMSRRLRKKILVVQYNIGVQHIKRHKYKEALECMDFVLKADPQNPHAIRKTLQLRKILEKMRRGKE
ncbi:MAG: hypothetical protein QG656_1076, partial [Candidatus Hydrogenedentes bacterium]|nr:hypothetical protein [Candidatus Hydrogenedentota bacterium]